MRPFYSASALYPVVRDRDSLQLDFMTKIDGLRSHNSLRSRADVVRFKAHEVRVATLNDIIRSKAAANRPEDRAVLPILRKTLSEKENA